MITLAGPWVKGVPFEGETLLEIDQTSAFDPTEAEPVPHHDFDPG